jgi:excisionase family DNA binding protein
MNNPFEIIEQRLSNIEYLLTDMKHLAGTVPNPADDIIQIDEFCKITGLTKQSAYGLVHRHEVPNIKKGKRLYFSKSEILEWIKTGRRKTLAESRMNPESHLKPLKQRKGAMV